MFFSLPATVTPKTRPSILIQHVTCDAGVIAYVCFGAGDEGEQEAHGGLPEVREVLPRPFGEGRLTAVGYGVISGKIEAWMRTL